MDKEMKVSVVAKDGEVKILTGKNFYTLEDKTNATFTTDCINSFVKYCRAFVNESLGHICYNATSATCIENDIDHETTFFAKLSMLKTDILEYLSGVKNTGHQPSKIDEIIDYMRPYFGENAMQFKSITRNTQIKSVTEAERVIDTMGNYKYAVTRKGLGREELKIPEIITFVVPVYELIEDTVEIPFDIGFNYKETGDEKNPLEIRWTLQCVDFDERVKKASIDIMKKYFSVFDEESVMYGSVAINVKDDGWKYKESSGQVL
jgi:hypothetical protein